MSVDPNDARSPEVRIFSPKVQKVNPPTSSADFAANCCAVPELLPSRSPASVASPWAARAALLSSRSFVECSPR